MTVSESRDASLRALLGREQKAPLLARRTRRHATTHGGSAQLSAVLVGDLHSRHVSQLLGLEISIFERFLY